MKTSYYINIPSKSGHSFQGPYTSEGMKFKTSRLFLIRFQDCLQEEITQFQLKRVNLL